MKNSLTGIMVLDLSRLLPGPFATKILAEMGATVIKIEPTDGGDYLRWMPPLVDDSSALFHSLNANKKSITLNLKSPDGVEILTRLARDADVLVEQFRPGVMDKLGIGYTDLAPLNERLVYLSLSGYGQTGPNRDRAGHDLNYLSLSGILSLWGTAANGPAMPGVQIADITGGLMAVIAALGALFERSTTGKGKFLDVSLADSLVNYLPFILGHVQYSEVKPGFGNLELNGKYACYNIYRTSDGRYMAVAALEPKFWITLCTILERPDFIPIQFVEDEAMDKLKADLASIFSTKSQKDWAALFSDADACVTPVRSVEEFIADKNTRERYLLGITRAGGKEFLFPALPIISSADSTIENQPSPRMGEHTEDLLKSAGFTKDDIIRFKASGITG